MSSCADSSASMAALAASLVLPSRPGGVVGGQQSGAHRGLAQQFGAGALAQGVVVERVSRRHAAARR